MRRRRRPAPARSPRPSRGSIRGRRAWRRWRLRARCGSVAACAGRSGRSSALGVGVEVGRPLAGHVGEEEQFRRPAWRGGLASEVIGVLALLPSQGNLRLAQISRCGTTEAFGGQHDPHHASARHGMTPALSRPIGPASSLVSVREDDPRGPHRRRDHALADDPAAHRLPHRPAAAADYLVSRLQPGGPGPELAHPAGDLRTLIASEARAAGSSWSFSSSPSRLHRRCDI